MQNSVHAVQTPAPVAYDSEQTSEQPAETGNLILRNDTILGVCEAVGQDFGFHANWLRVPLAAGVLISPVAVLAIYFGLGLAVLLSRLIAPAPRQAAAPRAPAQTAQHAADNQSNEDLLAA